VHFIANRSAPGAFRFAARTADAARAALAPFPDAARADAIVVVAGGRAFVRSDAIAEIARRLDPPWRAAAALRAVPRPWRDALYDVVARNRYRWFGRRSPGA
jgi:predicted DCC family thiol-disulfide oxidoreductase YuxK